MPIGESFTVAGVDGCKAGWLVARTSVLRPGSGPADGVVYQAGDLRVAPTFAEVLSTTMDDALDALVAAWTAGQAVLGKVTTLPENPPRDRKGLRMEMVYSIG